uniref:Metalloendopeptidase n=1 Tax=Colubraria reticulata TaxID=604273 RepID=A0A481SPQ1_9CAEN|nr:CreM12-ShK4 [Colubraria reticulata]
MMWVLKMVAVAVAVTWGGEVQASPAPLLTGDPYEDILSDPNFRPTPEKQPNITIDKMITSAYGGLFSYMSDNFLEMGGDVITELDLVLKQEQYMQMYGINHGRSKRKATRPLVFRWTDKTIPYEFIASHFSVDEIYYIKAAMARWQETTCLKFRPATRADKNRIRFQNGRGCNSHLGMTGGTQPINLEARGCRYSGLYLHEVGHAIGLVHEHQLPDRDQYIYVIYDNVAPSMRVWFNKYSTKDVNQYGVPYEYSSVMHYGVTAFSKDGSAQTIRARDRSKEKEIGRVYLKGLSFSDIKVVNKMYDCNKHCAKDDNCKEPAYLDKKCKCVRPDGDITTTTKPGSCTNVWDDGQCDGWSQSGECDKNPLWMKENCKKSCKVCNDGDDDDDDDDDDGDDGGKKPDGVCKNVWGDLSCDGWAKSGECDANAIWMKENCKKACKGCDARCTDNHLSCKSWASSGYCDTNWYTRDNCKQSCNTCGRANTEAQNNDGTNATMSQLMTILVVVTITGSYL